VVDADRAARRDSGDDPGDERAVPGDRIEELVFVRIGIVNGIAADEVCGRGKERRGRRVGQPAVDDGDAHRRRGPVANHADLAGRHAEQRAGFTAAFAGALVGDALAVRVRRGCVQRVRVDAAGLSRWRVGHAQAPVELDAARAPRTAAAAGMSTPTVGVDEVGVDRVGVDRVGVDRVGIDRVGIDGVRIDRVRVDRVRVHVVWPRVEEEHVHGLGDEAAGLQQAHSAEDITATDETPLLIAAEQGDRFFTLTLALSNRLSTGH
jgi:hypothetical protein